jgi:aldehyde dehydrogenase (NAD+)
MTPPKARDQEQAQGQVQKAFATDVDWESVFNDLAQNSVILEHYGELLSTQSPNESKILQVRTLVPLAVAHYQKKPDVLPAKRAGVLNGYRTGAEKMGISWRADATKLEERGLALWEKERAAVRKCIPMPEYYRACYEGPIHSYNRGNGEWMAAFDAPSAYLLVHAHHFPGRSPQEAFDALHEELNVHALKHLLDYSGCPIKCADIGCGVGTSTFSTVRALERQYRIGKVTGVDLSDYFITVAKHIQKLRAEERSGKIDLEFLHGNGLDLASCGLDEASLNLVVISEVTHEMPKTISEALFLEAARVLAPGGVLGYMDLNPVQILKCNSVGNLVDRVAASNEPYFDQYLELDVPGAMRAAGLEVLEETWPNHDKYPTLESCSLRTIIARKPRKLALETWTGKWALKHREEWKPYLAFLGVPEANHEMAAKAPDFHEYIVSQTSFFMDHRIPAQNLHLRFTGFLDGEWDTSPYPKPTAALFDKDSEHKEKESLWKHQWVEYPVSFESTILDFAGKGKTVTLRRELTSIDEIKFTVHVMDPESGAKLVGPCYTYMTRTSQEPPMNFVAELKEKIATGISRDLEWRKQAIDRVTAMVLENVDKISAAQAEDHVTPSNFFGASMMMKGAGLFYKFSVEKWAAPQKKEETAPAPMQTEGEWEVIPEPKGVGLVIAPWNAPVLLCALPLLGMLSAGNLCVLKPSEAAPKTSRLIARLVQKYFPDRSVVVAEGGKAITEELIDAPPDHIMFTGGGEVARIIAARAARHLTPLSLELGGKNPCFIDASESAQLSTYAKEIIGTKFYFGGQFCQAMDYCLVHEKVFDEFLDLLEKEIVALGDKRQCTMINAAHARRVRALLEGEESKARPAFPPVEAQAEDCVSLTLVVAPSLDSPLMSHEIFGPFLPVIKVSSAQDATNFVTKRPKPLVAYCYSQEPSVWEEFAYKTSSGNLAVNIGPQRMQSNFNVGFGGVGDSGYGHSIWGRAAFDDYSHFKPVFRGQKFGGSVWGAAKAPLTQ